MFLLRLIETQDRAIILILEQAYWVKNIHQTINFWKKKFTKLTSNFGW